ncbi:MAG: CARDB domain-containing protein [Candidatus Aenigmatarchaeota archaeon]
MKKLLILLLLLPLVAAKVDISLKTAYTNPYPIEPGKNFLLGVQVSNNGDEEAKNVAISLSPNSPFTIVDKLNEDPITLSPGAMRIIEYRLFVDSSAVSSTYQMPVKIKYSGSEEITRNIVVRVQGKPNIAYIEVNNFSISPGETKIMEVQLKNVGSGTAKRVIATLTPLTDNIKIVLSGGNYFVGDISYEDRKSAYFQIYVTPDTSYGVYDAIVRLIYEDEAGNMQVKNFSIGIFVTGKPQIKIIKVATDTSKGELKVDVINDGNAEARGIKGELMVGDSIVDVDYISKINAQKSSTLKFDIPPVKENRIDIRISYYGANNEQYVFKENISWRNKNKVNWVLLAIGLLMTYLLIKNFGSKVLTKLKRAKK